MSRIIDAHIHYADDASEFLGLLAEFDLTLLNICFAADYEDDWRLQSSLYENMRAERPNRFAWCTTFDLPRFDDERYIDRVIESLGADFRRGAVGCKIWKNVGMDVRKPDGSFLLIDDPMFAPVFEFLSAENQTLLMHMAEPLACWQPLDERSPHYDYYRTHPQWHMYNNPDHPSHAELIAARDRVAEQNPDLRIVAAHLASLEYDVDEVAARLTRYPNLAVDISARLGDLALQDSDIVRRFFIDYQDCILFGTDVVMRSRPSQMAEEVRLAEIDELRDTYRTHFAYLESAGQLTVKGIETRGLNLPPTVLDKIYRENALNWYPALRGSSTSSLP